MRLFMSNHTSKLMLFFSVYALSFPFNVSAREWCNEVLVGALYQANKNSNQTKTVRKVSVKSSKLKRTAASSSQEKNNISKLIYGYGSVQLNTKVMGVDSPMLGLEELSIRDGDSIETGEQSFAVVKAKDGSQITIPSHSVVKLTRVNKSPMYVELSKGRVQNTVVPQKNKINQTQKYKFFIKTPSLNLGVRGTDFYVEHEGDISIVSVHNGLVDVAQVLGDACRPVISLSKNEAAMVSSVSSQKNVMLSAPDLKSVPVFFRQNGVSFSFPKIEGAAQYHVQVANDPEFVALQEEHFSSEPQMKLNNIDNGYYYLRVTAIDQKGIEGATSIHRVLYQFE